MKINLFSFSHAKCSGSIRKLVCCADGVRKISPLQGDGNVNASLVSSVEMEVRKISPLQGDGNSVNVLVVSSPMSVRKISPLQGDGN